VQRLDVDSRGLGAQREPPSVDLTAAVVAGDHGTEPSPIRLGTEQCDQLRGALR
jgi:hypothetical protein